MSTTLHNACFGVDSHLIDLTGFASVGFTLARYHVQGFSSTELKKNWIDVSFDRRVEAWSGYLTEKLRNTGDTGLAYIENEAVVAALPQHERTQIMAVGRAVRQGKKWMWAGAPICDMGAPQYGRVDQNQAANDAEAPVIESAEGLCPYLYHPGKSWDDGTFDYPSSAAWCVQEAFRSARGRTLVPMFSLMTGDGYRDLTDREILGAFAACRQTGPRGERVGGVALFTQLWQSGDASRAQDNINRAVKLLGEAA